MGKFLKEKKVRMRSRKRLELTALQVVILLNGRYAGKKAVIVDIFDRSGGSGEALFSRRI